MEYYALRKESPEIGFLKDDAQRAGRKGATMIYTTLNRIRKHEPCAAGWRKLLKHLGKTEADDAPLAYSTILNAVGLDDALWCLRAEPHHAMPVESCALGDC